METPSAPHQKLFRTAVGLWSGVTALVWVNYQTNFHLGQQWVLVPKYWEKIDNQRKYT